MDHSLGNDISLSWIELDGLVFQIDEQLAIDDVEELIIGIVLVPVILTLKDAKPNHGFIDLAERLVIPLEFASIGKSFDIDNFQWFVENIQTSFVSILIGFGHGTPHGRTNSPTHA